MASVVLKGVSEGPIASFVASGRNALGDKITFEGASFDVGVGRYKEVDALQVRLPDNKPSVVVFRRHDVSSTMSRVIEHLVLFLFLEGENGCVLCRALDPQGSASHEKVKADELAKFKPFVLSGTNIYAVPDVAKKVRYSTTANADDLGDGWETKLVSFDTMLRYICGRVDADGLEERALELTRHRTELEQTKLELVEKSQECSMHEASILELERRLTRANIDAEHHLGSLDEAAQLLTLIVRFFPAWLLKFAFWVTVRNTLNFTWMTAVVYDYAAREKARREKTA